MIPSVLDRIDKSLAMLRTTDGQRRVRCKACSTCTAASGGNNTRVTGIRYIQHFQLARSFSPRKRGYYSARVCAVSPCNYTQRPWTSKRAASWQQYRAVCYDRRPRARLGGTDKRLTHRQYSRRNSCLWLEDQEPQKLCHASAQIAKGGPEGKQSESNKMGGDWDFAQS